MLVDIMPTSNMAIPRPTQTPPLLETTLQHLEDFSTMIGLGLVEETIKEFHTSKHSSTTLLVVHIVHNLKESIFNVPSVLAQ